MRTNLRTTAATILPLLATVLTLAPLAGRLHTGAGMVIFGAALCLTTARQAAHARGIVHRLVMLPVTVLAGVVVAGLFHLSLVLGDAMFVATAVFATVGRAVGPRTAAVGRALLLPMLALFIAPVRLGPDPWKGLAWAAVAGMIALIWTLSAEPLAPKQPMHTQPTALPTPTPPPTTTDAQPQPQEHAQPQEQARRTTDAKTSVHLRRAAHTGVGLTLAFILGQAFFSTHWTWVVISAFTVGITARSRGDVILKAIQRTLGAAAGTLAATVLTTLVAGRPVLTVSLILAFLTAGVFLRELNYTWWALCLTSVLALLYALDGVTGSLALRLLAIVVGGACAVLPAVFLKPIKTRALVRKRTGAALRSLRDALQDPVHAHQAHADLAALRDSAKPLRWIKARELSWVDDLTAAGARLGTVDSHRETAATLRRIRAELTS